MELTRETSLSVQEQVDIDHRKQLMDLLYGQYYLADRSMIFLASGAIGLSILFLEKLDKGALQLPLIYGAWGSFFLSLTAVLASLYFSQRLIRQEIQYFDHLILESDDPVEEPEDWLVKTTKSLSGFSLVAFVIGGILLAVFAVCNLPQQ